MSVVKVTLPLLRPRLSDCCSSPLADEWSISPVVSEGLKTREMRVAESAEVVMALLYPREELP